MRVVLLALLALLLIGCSSKRSIVGYWKVEKTGAVIVFEESGVLALATGADVNRVGTWKMDANKLIIVNNLLGGLSGPVPVSSDIKWLADNRIRIKPFDTSDPRAKDAPDSVEMELTRMTPAMQADMIRQSQDKVASKPGAPTLVPDGSSDGDVCLNNLKQIGSGMLIYATDFDDTLPPPYTWGTTVRPYVKDARAFTCPTVERQGQTGGYAYNSLIAGALLRTFTSPETMPTLFETENLTEGATEEVNYGLSIPRHNDVICAAYADGHAKKLPSGVRP